jgi:ribosome biogenesis protein Tsr3
MLLLFGDELELLSDLDRNIFLLTLRVRLWHCEECITLQCTANKLTRINVMKVQINVIMAMIKIALLTISDLFDSYAIWS